MTFGGRCVKLGGVDADAIAGDLAAVLYTPEQIQERVVALAEQIDADYADKKPLLVGVLNGAVMIMADLCRELTIDCEMDWMAVSSYGSGTKSSGVVRFLKDLSVDIHDRHVLVVEDIIDTGLTLSWLLSNLSSRQPASLEVAAMFRKPEAIKADIECRYIGYDIPNEFVVGYGLDYDGRYRGLKGLAVIKPEVYS